MTLVAARPAFQAATPSPPPQAAGGGGGGTAAAKNFSIVRSPFSSTPNTGAALPAQPLSPESELDGSPAKRLRASDGAAGHPGALHAQLAGGPASRQRPPRPPPLFSDGGSPGLADLPAGQGALASPPGVRSPGGGSSRKGRQQAKTMGRVCVECGTTTTTQWRSQGLLCNSCGVKHIKRRLPMTADDMQRRWMRLPPAIRDHPMWLAAQVVAEAQQTAARAAAAGEPWSCPGCGAASQERVAGPCGLQCCPPCRIRLQPSKPTGAAAAAATMAAPPSCLVADSVTPPATSPSSGLKRRKQTAPRSSGAGLSPVSRSSSGSGSIAWSWQGLQPEVEGQQDEAASQQRRAARRPVRQAAASRAALRRGASTTAAQLADIEVRMVDTSPAMRGTPTAAEAAAALLVLTESAEARLESAAVEEMNRQTAAAIAEAATAAQAAAVQAAGPAGLPPSQQQAPYRADSGALAAAAAAALDGRRLGPATSLDLIMQLLAKNSSSGQLGPSPSLVAAAAAPPIIRLPSSLPLSGEDQPSSSSGDSVQLYQQLIAASADAEAAEAGLTAHLVGQYLAALMMPAQTLAAAGGGADTQGAAAAIKGQQEQQARLVGAMAAERQFTAAVSLMRSVVQLSGLDQS